MKKRELRDSSEGTRSEANVFAFSRRDKEQPRGRRADCRNAAYSDEYARIATREREGACARLIIVFLHAQQLVNSRPATTLGCGGNNSPQMPVICAGREIPSCIGRGSGV